MVSSFLSCTALKTHVPGGLFRNGERACGASGPLGAPWGPAVGVGNFSVRSNLRTASRNLDLALGGFLPHRLTLWKKMLENPAVPLFVWGTS